VIARVRGVAAGPAAELVVRRRGRDSDLNRASAPRFAIRAIIAANYRLAFRLLTPFLALAVAACVDQPAGDRGGTPRTGIAVVAHTPDTAKAWALLEIVIVGRVVDVEPDEVEVAFTNRAPKDPKEPYKVAIVRIEDWVFGASGLTLVRIGFPANGPAMALKPDMEGCLTLAFQPGAGFYTQIKRMTEKAAPGFAGEVERLRKRGRVLNDPVAALKAKGLDDRFDAAMLLLERYATPRESSQREPVPEQENGLILILMAELPWQPRDGRYNRADGGLVPHRKALWSMIDPRELGFDGAALPKPREVGSRQPDPTIPPASNRSPTPEMMLDEESARFLKENSDKIRLKRFVQK
jgi:hypothetical protein